MAASDRYRRQGYGRQRGVVLIMALLIVALVTTVVVSVSWRFNLSMARNENRWHGSQARAYLEGGEQLARLVLREDMQQGPIDHIAEVWAQQGDPLPTDEGWIRGRIEDAHGRLNLNLMAQQFVGVPDPSLDMNDPTVRFTASQRRLIRLLQTFELESGPLDVMEATAIVEALQDWIDMDSETSGMGGAEQDYYSSEGIEYPIPNGPIASVSEIMLIRGMTPEIYRKLEPYVIALDTSANLNINTMPPALFRTFNVKANLEPLEEDQANVLMQARNATMMTDENGVPLKGGFQTAEEFASDPTVQSIIGSPEEGETKDLVVGSNYFLYFGETLVGEQVRRSKAVLYRSGADVSVVRRTDAGF